MPRRFWPVAALAGRRLGVAALAAGCLVLAWQLVTLWADPPAYLLPAPGAVLAALRADPGAFASHGAVTCAEIGLGLALATLGALVWAAALVSLPRLRAALLPLFVVAQSTPKEALAPVFIIWWGFTPLPKVMIAALISFFPMLIATIVGLDRFTDEQRRLAASMGAGWLTTLLVIRLRVALPSFLGGLRLGVTFAAVGAVIAEYLGSDRGLGYLALGASRRLDGGVLYASLIVLVLIALGMVRLVSLAEAVSSRHTRVAAEAQP